MNPNCVTGFSDAESCLGFRIRNNPKLKVGWEVIPYFFINLHSKDLPVLLELKKFWGVGNISIMSDKDSALYQINSIDALYKVVIPHFYSYPLELCLQKNEKIIYYLLFRQAIESCAWLLLKNKEHLTLEGEVRLKN